MPQSLKSSLNRSDIDKRMPDILMLQTVLNEPRIITGEDSYDAERRL